MQNPASKFVHANNAATDLDERVEFIGLDEKARDTLRQLRPLIASEIEPALDEFYKRLGRFPTVQGFFSDPDAMARAKTRQAAHWSIIAGGRFDAGYVRAVRAVGETHARLGLPPRWYIGAYALVAEQLVRAVLVRAGEQQGGDTLDAAAAITSLMKAVFLDMDLAISIYLEALEERRRLEEEGRLVAERNQTVVVRALADALARVAEGDLTASVDQEVSAEYLQLKSDFNGALAKLVEARKEAEAASRAKSDFLSNISHEIRTPLNGVIGVAGALAASNLSPRQQEMVDLIKVSAATLERLLTDVLDVSKFEAGAVTLEVASFDLKHVIDGAVGLFRARSVEKGIGLGVKFEGLPEKPVSGDAVRLAQVITNLVSNAIKFTSEGGVKVLVRCMPEQEPPRLKVFLEVADTGIGFDPELAASLFDRFSQADTSITRKFGGTGLGLAICKRIAEAMGGEISAMSQPDFGSRFCVVMYFDYDDGVESLPDARPLTAGQALFPDFSKLPSGRPRILLVEDHPVNRQVVRVILEPLGVDIVEASDGAEAVRIFRDQRFDLILMDMQMPVLDGLAATREIRAMEAASGVAPTKIVMLTANVADVHRRSGRDAGADRHLAKPVQRDALVAVVLDAVKTEGEASA